MLATALHDDFFCLDQLVQKGCHTDGVPDALLPFPFALWQRRLLGRRPCAMFVSSTAPQGLRREVRMGRDADQRHLDELDAGGVRDGIRMAVQRRGEGRQQRLIQQGVVRRQG